MTEPARPTVTVRAAYPADLEFIVDGNARLASETEGVELDRALLVPGVAAVLDDRSRGRYFIAEMAGRSVGQLMLTYEWSDWRNGVFWWIQSVYVVQDARAQGVFGTLMRHVEAAARADAGVCGLRLYVERQNTRAQAIYRHLGLQTTHYELMETVFRGQSSHRD